MPVGIIFLFLGVISYHILDYGLINDSGNLSGDGSYTQILYYSLLSPEESPKRSEVLMFLYGH